MYSEMGCMNKPSFKSTPVHSFFRFLGQQNVNMAAVVSLTFLFFVVALIGICHHEIWRDEMEAWSLVRSAPSLSYIFHTLPYIGHPSLWYLILYQVVQFTSNPFAMQLIHVGIATVSMFVFLRFAPFNWLIKILFIFGYFPLYEYTIKARSYSLGILFVFLICALWKNRHKHYLLISLFLFLLFQTSAMGAILGLSISGALILDYHFVRPPSTAGKKPSLLLPGFIILIGLGFFILQVLPPPDGGIAVGWDWGIHFGKIVKVFSFAIRTYVFAGGEKIIGYYPYFLNMTAVYVWFQFSLLAAFFFFLIFIKKPIVLALFLLGNTGFLTFFYTKYIGYPWHHGHLFILLIVCLWIAKFYPEEEFRLFGGVSSFIKKVLPVVIFLLMASQFIYGVKAYYNDLYRPYSCAKETAQYIKDAQLNRLLLVGDVDYIVAAVAGHLGQDIYYPKSRRFGNHVICFKDKYGRAGLSLVCDTARTLQRESKKDAVLILTYEVGEKEMADNQLVLLKKFEGSIFPDEIFYLYRLDCK